MIDNGNLAGESEIVKRYKALVIENAKLKTSLAELEATLANVKAELNNIRDDDALIEMVNSNSRKSK